MKPSLTLSLAIILGASAYLTVLVSAQPENDLARSETTAAGPGSPGENIQGERFPINSLELYRTDSSSLTGSPNLEEAIRFAIDHDRFPELISMLQKELYAPVKKDREISGDILKKLSKLPAWKHGLNVHHFIQYFSAEKFGNAAKATEESEAFYYWMLTTPEALSQLLFNLKPQDDLEKSLAIWQGIWSSEETPELQVKYLNLAIACALVFDKGKIMIDEEYGAIEPLERYKIFRDNAEAKRLKTVISQMKVSDLVWVVDVPIIDEEIEWAVRRANFSRRSWGRAYGHISYLMERAVNGENPYDGYYFSEIEKHGGICGDQTYFSANTAKSNGIPAAGVTGWGDRGGHAWLAYKPKDDEWDTSTGRYENYSNGRVKNSQTNEFMPEFDLMLMSERKMKEAYVQEAETILRFVPILAKMNHEPLGIRQTLEVALDIAPLHTNAWDKYVAFLETFTPELTKEQWEDLVSKMERTFKEHPTMWMTAREITKKHIWKDLEEEEINTLEARYRNEIARKFPMRGDLIRQLLKDQFSKLGEKEDFEELCSFNRKVFRLFGKDTLNFQFMANRYFEIGSQYPEHLEEICDDIERYFGRYIDQESSDFFKAETEIQMMRMISNFYKKTGNAEKAEKLEEEATERLEKAMKDAV